MSRETFVLRNGELVPKHLASPRSGSAAPMVITDEMSATWHPANGRKYESKSAFRRVTKAHGCVEVGNDADRPRTRDPLPSVGADVKAAFEQLRSGYRPPPLERASVPAGSDARGNYPSIPIDRIRS